LAYMPIGIAFDRSKNYEDAIDFTRKGMAIAKNIDDKGNVAEALDDISSVYAQMNLPDSGIVYAQEAVNLASELRDTLRLSYCLATLGENYMAKTEYDLALPFLKKAISYAESVNYHWSLTYNVNDMAQ